MKNLSFKEYWNNSWKAERKNNHIYDFIYDISAIVKGKKTYFEVGCAPGNMMAFFYEQSGMEVSGVDFCDPDIISKCLLANDVEKYEFYNQDFNEFAIEKKFDVVASYGFIEHFDNYEEIIKKHLALINKDGYLAITLPNFRYFNKFVVSIINKKLLNMHNLDIMDPVLIKETILTNGDFEIVYADYYKTCFLFFNPENPDTTGRVVLKYIIRSGRKLLKLLKLDNISNKFFSPYIMVIAQRKN